jgi:ribose transport system substrate-binding protein
MIRFTEGSASTRLREEGFTSEIAKTPALKLVAQQFTDGSMAGAQRVAETLLNNYVKNGKLELAGVYASNQVTAEGAYNALKSLRKKGIEVSAKFVGFDDSTLLIQGLQTGVIDALVVQDPEKMGYLGVKSLVDHLNGKPVEAYVDTGVTVKTKADLAK